MLMKGGWFDLNSFNIRRDQSVNSPYIIDTVSKGYYLINTRISAELMHYYGIEFVSSLFNINVSLHINKLILHLKLIF